MGGNPYPGPYTQEHLEKLAMEAQRKFNPYMQNDLQNLVKQPFNIHIAGQTFDGLTGEKK